MIAPWLALLADPRAKFAVALLGVLLIARTVTAIRDDWRDGDRFAAFSTLGAMACGCVWLINILRTL